MSVVVSKTEEILDGVLNGERPVEDRARAHRDGAHVTAAPAETKRSSGTLSSSPTSRASSRNV